MIKTPTQRTASRIQQRHVRASIKHVWTQQVGDCSPRQTWSPSVNVYRLADELAVCVDLAGVEQRNIEVRVGHDTVLIRGNRLSPDPHLASGDEGLRIICMEIDHGPFCRQVDLPQAVVADDGRVEYRDGLLWIHLPIGRSI